jgi:hypothetical protein
MVPRSLWHLWLLALASFTMVCTSPAQVGGKRFRPPGTEAKNRSKRKFGPRMIRTLRRRVFPTEEAVRPPALQTTRPAGECVGSSSAEFGGPSGRPCRLGTGRLIGAGVGDGPLQAADGELESARGELSKSVSLADQSIDRVGGVVGNVERAVGAGYGIYRAPPTRAIGELEA